MSTGFDELLWAVTNYDPEHPDYEELSDIGDGQYLASTAADLIQELQRELTAAQAALARVRELAAKWRAAPQDPEEPLLAMAADELDAAIQGA